MKKKELFSRLIIVLHLLIVIRGTIFVRPRDFNQFSVIDLHAVYQIVLVAMCLSILLLSRRFFSEIRSISFRPLGVLIIYYLICAASALWSPEQIYTFYKATEYLILATSIHFSLSLISFDKVERIVVRIGLAIISLDAVKHVILGGFNIQGLHTNSYTIVAAMLALFGLANILSPRSTEDKWRSLGLIFTSLMFLIMGTSSASLISAATGLLILFVVTRNRFVLLVTLLSLIACALYFSIDDLLALFFPGRTLEQIQHGTGRARIWELTLQQIRLHPWLGSGFSASSRMLEFSVTNAHNGYLAVLLGTGVLGLFVFFVFLGKLVFQGISLSLVSGQRELGCVIAIIVLCINNLSFSALGEGWSSTSLFFIAFISMQEIKHRRYSRPLPSLSIPKL